MLDSAIIPIFQALYTILHSIAGIFWWIDQAILLVGFYITALTDWLVNTALSPMIGSIANQTTGLLAPVFVLAMTVLGITYLLAVFGTIQIVSMRSAILWLLFAAFVYQVGPQLYQGTEHFRRGIGGMFYEEGISALASGSSDITALSQISTSSEAVMLAPANQFGAWLPYDTAVDGLDVAMAYLYADGCDVVRSSGCIVIGTLPYGWYFPGSAPTYFDNTSSPPFYPTMTNDDRLMSLELAAAGIWRLASGTIVAAFGLIEQVIHFVLALAMGVAYLSLMIGVLFAFFKRTEPIAWSVFDLVIELFIQSIITSLMLSLVISFVIIGASTGNAVVLFGAAFIGLLLAIVLLVGVIKALQNAANRILGAMSQATGGNLGAAGQFTGVASSAIGGSAALMQGASLAQAAGIAFSGTNVAQTAYYATAAFGQDSSIGSLASQVFEGAAAGRVVSPIVAGFMVPRMSRNRDDGNKDDNDEVLPLDAEGAPVPSPHRAVGSPIPNESYESVTDHDDTSQYYARISRLSDAPPATSLSQESVDFLYAYNAARIRQQSGLPSYDDYANGTVGDSTQVSADNATTAIPAASDRSTTSRVETDATNGEHISKTIAAKVDVSDDDDFARLSNTVIAANMSASPLNTEPIPEAREYTRISDGLHLSQQQSQAVAQQVIDTGSIGTQLATALRSHLASLPTRSGTPLSEANISRAIRGLEQAANRMATVSVTDEIGETLEMQVTLGKPPIAVPTPPSNANSEGQ